MSSAIPISIHCFTQFYDIGNFKKHFIPMITFKLMTLFTFSIPFHVICWQYTRISSIIHTYAKYFVSFNLICTQCLRYLEKIVASLFNRVFFGLLCKLCLLVNGWLSVLIGFFNVIFGIFFVDFVNKLWNMMGKIEIENKHVLKACWLLTLY